LNHKIELLLFVSVPYTPYFKPQNMKAGLLCTRTLVTWTVMQFIVHKVMSVDILVCYIFISCLICRKIWGHHVVKLLSLVLVTKMRFGLVIGFINHVQVVTTIGYHSVPDVYTPNHSTLSLS
jgi:hypothetical protein